MIGSIFMMAAVCAGLADMAGDSDPQVVPKMTRSQIKAYLRRFMKDRGINPRAFKLEASVVWGTSDYNHSSLRHWREIWDGGFQDWNSVLGDAAQGDLFDIYVYDKRQESLLNTITVYIPLPGPLTQEHLEETREKLSLLVLLHEEPTQEDSHLLDYIHWLSKHLEEQNR